MIEMKRYFTSDWHLGSELILEKCHRPFKNIQQMDKFIELCKKNNAQVLFVEMPAVASWNYERHNAVQKYADSRGIAFLDINLLYDEVGISMTNCFRDMGNHLNYYSARAVTQYMAHGYDSAIFVSLCGDVGTFLLALSNRLFQEHVITPLESLHTRMIMSVIRSGYHHGIRKSRN